MKHVCEKCGTPLDKYTGLCPVCDGDEFVPMDEFSETSEETVTRKGIIAIFLAIISILIVVSVIIVAVLNGWIGGKENRAASRSSFITYYNETLYSKHGVMDTDHPDITGTGMLFAEMTDLSGDKTDEFIVGYAAQSGDNIDYNISCYEYNPNSVIQGADNPSATVGVDMNKTLVAFSEDDFTRLFSTHEPHEFQLYKVEGKDKNYIFFERVTEGKWECKVYTITAGSFTEFDTLELKKVSDENSKKAEKFFGKYKLKDMSVSDGDGKFTLTKQEKDALIFTYSYSLINDTDKGETDEYIINDYTNSVSFLNDVNRAEFEKTVKKNEETDKKENVTDTDIVFGSVVKKGHCIYFWRYNSSSFSEEGSESGNYKYKSGAENQLVRRDEDGTETVLVETAGAGNLAIAGNRIFFQKANGNSNSYNVDSCDMSGNDVTFHDTGVIEGVVQDGAYVVYSPERTRYEFGTIKSIKTIDLEKVNTVYNARFLACDGERVYYQAEQAEYSEARHGKTTVSSVFANGSANRVLYVSDSDLYEDGDAYSRTVSLVRDAYISGDYIYYVYGSYNSSEDEFLGGNIVKAKLDGSGGEILGESNKDYFTVNSSGKLVNGGDASMNGYTYDGGTVYKFNPATGKNEELLVSKDYSQFTSENATGKGSADSFVTLDFAVKSEDKLYFMIKSGKASSDGYKFSGCALFEKDTESGKTVMLYSVTNNGSEETEE